MARPHPHTIAYLRVSTHEQDVAKNQTDILLLAHRQQLGHVQFVEETVSGRAPWRRRKIAQVLDTRRRAIRWSSVKFIPIKSWVPKGAGAPGSCAGRNRAPSRDRGRPPSTGGSGLGY
jgi:hypothetical protein